MPTACRCSVTTACCHSQRHSDFLFDLFTCTTTPYRITQNPQEIAIHNPDAAVLWPGALIRGDSRRQIGSLELLAVSREKRAPLGISIQGYGVLGIPETPLAINQVEPISFTMGNLYDNRLVQVANVTDYSVRECQPAAAQLPQPIHWWTADSTFKSAKNCENLSEFLQVTGLLILK